MAEQLGISHERVKIWTCGSCPRIKNLNGASRLSNFWNFFVWGDPNDILSRLVSMGETWLYYNDPEAKQQSMEWWQGGSPHTAPQKSECKYPLETFSPRFFWGIKTASSSLNIFQRAKLSTRSIAHLCWCN
jgi:hypothetical protein